MSKFIQALEKAPRTQVILGSVAVAGSIAGLMLTIMMSRGKRIYIFNIFKSMYNITNKLCFSI
jgi:ApbE superfamily uncharacterized protein (UPF0280 family)